jgi:hypothetical protein
LFHGVLFCVSHHWRGVPFVFAPFVLAWCMGTLAHRWRRRVFVMHGRHASAV